jgi:ABC-type phosphate/phosphonate transport system substrate-binding protein
MLKLAIRNISWKIEFTGFSLILAGFIFSLLPNAAYSQDTLRLVIQPIQSEQRTREIFQPMADYFQHLTGQKVEIITYPNFISYWMETQKPDSYDIAFDAAHFIDFRDKNMDYTVLAKQPGSVSISLVVTEDALVFEAEELIGKKIATLGPPSIPAARIDEIFDNPVRQPTIVEGNDSAHVMSMLLSGEVDAAMIPTPLVSAQMAAEGGIAMVLTTETVPSMGVSVSANVPAEIREKLHKGLVEAEKTPEGRKMLEETKLNPFEKTTNQEYFGFSELLDQL